MYCSACWVNSTCLTFSSSRIRRGVLLEPRLVGRRRPGPPRPGPAAGGPSAWRPSARCGPARRSRGPGPSARRAVASIGRRAGRRIVAQVDALGCTAVAEGGRRPGSATAPRPETARTGRSACRWSAGTRRASSRRRSCRPTARRVQNRSRLRRTYQLLRASTNSVSSPQAA